MGLALAHIVYSQSDARTVASSFEAAGIFVQVFDSNTSSLFPHMNVALGGIQIMVAEDQLSDARALIADIGLQPTGIESESEAFTRNRGKGIGGLLAFVLGGMWFPWWNNDRKWK